ncbi:MAG: uncharacterized protein JWQ45_2928 [Blastococcus sp.]|nr:uncharacterized protein [Blastococcus sp.]
MAAVAVRTDTVIPSPRRAGDDAPRNGTPGGPAAAGYQRVLHQLVRRELRMLADLATWAPAGEAPRTAALTGHAELIGHLLLHHHSVEREAVWPALLRTVPVECQSEVRAALDDCTARCARIDHMLRNVSTAARQWAVAATPQARNSFAVSCRALADAVDTQTADEERALLPLLATYLRAEDWIAIARSWRCRLTAAEQLLVLGLALEDACATDRARLLGGLSPATRTAWRVYGRRQYRAAVVRLRGAPPAS